MKVLWLAAFSAAALLGSDACAADLTTSETYIEAPSVVERDRVICDEFARCWREPQRRAMIMPRDSYNTMPRGQLIERRYYDDRYPADTGPYAPRASVDGGVGYRW